jgi:hypothetical protein
VNDKYIIYLIIGILIAHFVFAVGYLIWKIVRGSNKREHQIELDEHKEPKTGNE